MDKNDAEYLDKFRDVAAKQKQIEGMIAELRAICDSLKDWRKTAVELDSPEAGVFTRQEWSDSKIKGLLALRPALVKFSQEAGELKRLWNGLGDNSLGLADPKTLQEK